MLKPLTVWITTNWKVLKEMGAPNHPACLLKNLYVGQEAMVRIGQGKMYWFKVGKGVRQGCIPSPCLKVKVKVAQWCPTLCDPMDYTIHGILQARILELVALPFSRGSSQTRDRTHVICLTGRFFITEPLGKPS